MGKTFRKLINKQLEMLFIGESSERDPFRCHFRTDCWLGVGAGGVSGDLRGGPYVVMLQIKTMRVSVAPRRQMDTEIHENCGTLARRHPAPVSESERACLWRDGTIWLKYAANAVIITLKRTFASLVPTAGQSDVSGDDAHEGKCITRALNAHQSAENIHLCDTLMLRVPALVLRQGFSGNLLFAAVLTE